jgi:hypothetical protein
MYIATYSKGSNNELLGYNPSLNVLLSIIKEHKVYKQTEAWNKFLLIQIKHTILEETVCFIWIKGNDGCEISPFSNFMGSIFVDELEKFEIVNGIDIDHVRKLSDAPFFCKNPRKNIGFYKNRIFPFKKCEKGKKMFLIDHLGLWIVQNPGTDNEAAWFI